MATVKDPLYFYSSFDSREELEMEELKREQVSAYNKKNDATWLETYDRWIDRKLYQSAKKNSKSKNIPFTITLDNVIRMWELQEGKCILSGAPLTWNNECEITRASLDQIVPSAGYELHKVWLVSNGMNTLKMHHPLYDLVKIIPSLADNQTYVSVCASLTRGEQPKHNNSLLPLNIENNF